MKKIIVAIASALAVMGCTSQRMAEREVLCGGYTKFRKMTAEERTLFADTYKSETQLTPSAVATQVVAGMNYKFRCKDSKKNTYEVVIYKPLPNQGEPVVSRVTKCNGDE